MTIRLLVIAACAAGCAALCLSCGAPRTAPEAAPGEAPKELVPLAREFVALMDAGDFEAAAARFDARMADAMPPGRLEEAWNGLESQLGQLEEQVGARTTKEQGYDCVYVTCRFARGRADVKVVFDAGGKVSGLWFVPPSEEAGS